MVSYFKSMFNRYQLANNPCQNQMIKLGGNPISNSSSTINIILDTFNPLVWIKFATYVKSKSPTYSVFISSHPLNFISIDSGIFS